MKTMKSAKESYKHSNSQGVNQGSRCRRMKNTHTRFSQISG